MLQVKVDNLYVKGMYTWLRSVCTVALHTHIKQLGGPGVKVQVGVISLGTTSQDGNKREVKVEVLGILETTTRHIRLRAVEPLADGERNYKKRFTKILEPVFNWVHPSSIIVTDLTVDKATLHQMGFLNVCQSTSTDYSQSNRTIMEYLRRIVPRMFQNTLSLLSRQIIQQFLDELVWREWFGTTVLQCFDNMVQHLSEQTRFDSGTSLIVRLNKISSNPFKNWSIPIANNNSTSQQPKAPPVEPPTPKRYSRQRKPATPQPPVTVTQEVPRPAKSTSPDVPEQLVPLENYYYGTINPFQNAKNKTTINIKCPFCKLTFNTNISLMNHLFKHAHNVSNDVQLCKYCLTIVPSGNDLLKHIGTAHPDETKFDNGFVCLICEAHFRNPFILGKHMSKEHCPSELPYMCGTCNFRCSNHKQAVDHFYQQHDHGTTIQCPFCLKSTTIFSGGRNISQNMNYFIQHLQKHQKKQLAKRCGRCTLWFIQKEFLKDHQTKMHISQRGKHGLVPCFAPRNGVMVPKSRMDKCPDDAKVINFSALYFNVSKNLNCRECNKPLNTPKHFASFESCQNPNCQYSTCCSNSMQEHVSKCKFLNAKLPEEKLPYKMFCICGYSDTSGNMMAKHLAICEKKSAYPSQEAAKKATATHSMLDVLGLVRKPDEASSSKEPAKRETTHPIILKPRGKPGRPRKVVENTEKPPPVIVNEVIELNDDDSKSDETSEVKINISDVRGGVEAEVKDEEKKKGDVKESKEVIEISDDKIEKKEEKVEEKTDTSDDVVFIENSEPESSEKPVKNDTQDEKKSEEKVEEVEQSETTASEKHPEEEKSQSEMTVGDEKPEEEKSQSETLIEEVKPEEEKSQSETLIEEVKPEEEKSQSETLIEEGKPEVENSQSETLIKEGKSEEEKNESEATIGDEHMSVEENCVPLEEVEEEEKVKPESSEEEVKSESFENVVKPKLPEEPAINSECSEKATNREDETEENQQTEKAVVSEPMEVDSCNNTEEMVDKEGDKEAIENSVDGIDNNISKENTNINNEVCPMDTD